MTLSQQAVLRHGMVAVQLELSYRLRHELTRDASFLERFGQALHAGFSEWSAGVEPTGCTAPDQP